MKHKKTIGIALLIAFVFVLYMITYKVNFNEAAVVTTFGKAAEESVYFGHMADTSESTRPWGNLRLKLPWPIQAVRTYDLRVQVLEDRLDEQQTLDKQSVIVNTYIAWRVVDPLAFYRSLVTEEEARRQIQSLLRAARSVIGNYTFDQLTNTDESKLKLARVEADILAKLDRDLERHEQRQQSWGIRFESVGIKRIVLPEAVTLKVFERMRATREALAQRAISEGDAEAANIRAQARSARDAILAFAQRRADQIRTEGDEAAAQYYALFEQDEGFAIFLNKLNMLRETLSNNTTFFFDARNFLFQELFQEPTPSTVRDYATPPSQPPTAEAGASAEQAADASTLDPTTAIPNPTRQP